jgi:hypothetical protein
MITSGRVRDAFDLNQEPESVRAGYGDRPFRVINQECNVVRYHESECQTCWPRCTTSWESILP